MQLNWSELIMNLHLHLDLHRQAIVARAKTLWLCRRHSGLATPKFNDKTPLESL
jgi:hypothetical protein